MNKLEQRKEIRTIFEADVKPNDVTITFNKMLDTMTVEVRTTMLTSGVSEELFDRGYTKFTISTRDHGLRFNVYFKDVTT